MPLCVPSRPCPSKAPTHSAERRAVALSHRPLEEGEEEGEEEEEGFDDDDDDDEEEEP